MAGGDGACMDCCRKLAAAILLPFVVLLEMEAVLSLI